MDVRPQHRLFLVLLAKVLVVLELLAICAVGGMMLGGGHQRSKALPVMMEIYVAPRDAVVEVNGRVVIRPVGQSWVHVPVPASTEVALRVSRPGYRSAQRTLTSPPEGTWTSSVSLSLEDEAAKLQVNPESGGAAGLVNSAQEARVAVADDGPPTGPSGTADDGSNRSETVSGGVTVETSSTVDASSVEHMELPEQGAEADMPGMSPISTATSLAVAAHATTDSASDRSERGALAKVIQAKRASPSKVRARPKVRPTRNKKNLRRRAGDRRSTAKRGARRRVQGQRDASGTEKARAERRRASSEEPRAAKKMPSAESASAGEIGRSQPKVFHQTFSWLMNQRGQPTLRVLAVYDHGLMMPWAIRVLRNHIRGSSLRVSLVSVPLTDMAGLRTTLESGGYDAILVDSSLRDRLKAILRMTRKFRMVSLGIGRDLARAGVSLGLSPRVSKADVDSVFLNRPSLAREGCDVSKTIAGLATVVR